MRNEYGDELDLNGYAPSIMSHDRSCLWCQRTTGEFARHEVFHGANREKSKRYGLWVYLCPNCHFKLHGLDAKIDHCLKVQGQRRAEFYYGWTDKQFREKFGKNYL